MAAADAEQRQYHADCATLAAVLEKVVMDPYGSCHLYSYSCTVNQVIVLLLLFFNHIIT